jgi:hypothetical protein
MVIHSSELGSVFCRLRLSWIQFAQNNPQYFGFAEGWGSELLCGVEPTLVDVISRIGTVLRFSGKLIRNKYTAE